MVVFLVASISRRALAALALIALLAAVSVTNAQVSQPNVLVFFVDDMGWTDWQYDATLNPNGSVVYETPNMLRLAQDGMVFDNAYASAPVCSPTRAALLTGKTPARIGLTDFLGGGNNKSASLQSPVWTTGLPGAEVTIAEALGSNSGGYDTAFIGKWHADSGPTSHGYDFNIAGGGAGCPCSPVSDGFFAGSDGGWAGMPGITSGYPADAYLTDVLGDFAEQYISDHANGPDPFFLTFAPYQVHVPLQAPADTVSKYQTKIADLTSQGVDLGGHDNAIYAAMLEEMDSALGRALDRLEDPNGDGNTADSIRDDTVIVFASDNGGLTISELGSAPATNNSPLREGKGSLYEGGIRSPFIVSYTGDAAVGRGVTSSARVSTHDLYPTLLELADVDNNPAVPKNAVIDGVSFAGALRGEAHARGYQYWHYPHESNQHKLGGATVTGGSFVSSIRDDTHKAIYFYETGEYELYDLIADIGETTDLTGADAGKAFELSAALHVFLRDSGAAMPVARQGGLPRPLPEVLWPTVRGDFDDDGALGIGDWNRLKGSFFADLGDVTPAEGYFLGDITLDGVVDRLDFAAFKDEFDTAFGQGAFEQLIAIVPEPSSAWFIGLGILARVVPSTRRGTE